MTSGRQRDRAMARRRMLLAAAGSIACAISPATAQEATLAGPPAPAVAPAPAASIDPAVAAYYALRPGAQVWFRDADTRTAAMKLPAILKAAAIDGLADG